MPKGLIAIRAGHPIIDAVGLGLTVATADSLREYVRADDGATASGAVLGVPVIAQ